LLIPARLRLDQDHTGAFHLDGCGSKPQPLPGWRANVVIFSDVDFCIPQHTTHG